MGTPTERFKVRDSKGSIHFAIVTHKIIDTSTLQGSSSVKGLPSYKLETGAHLNTDDGNTFTHWVTKERFERIEK